MKTTFFINYDGIVIVISTLFVICPLVAVTVTVPDSAVGVVVVPVPVPLEIDPLELPPPQLTAPNINTIIAAAPQA
jgi:hypothetical protein